ncbi:MAG TPA: endo-1,4-beta-xylanase [Actinomycetota bacterium]|nr:endo-1,4-beta-xylanase [Actinomycetota bacterium]
MTADRGGDHYGPGDAGRYSLAAELIRSKRSRLDAQLKRYRRAGLRPQRALEDLVGAASRDGERASSSSERLEPAGASTALLDLVDACDAVELAYARSRPTNHQQEIGCDVTMIGARAGRVWQHLRRLLTYVTVTFYTRSEKTGAFEASEGTYAFARRDALVERAAEAGLQVEGRPLVWLHPWATPAWLATKDLEHLRSYIELRIPAIVGHYGDRILCWEVINEAHDWADVHHLSHEELVEVTRLACDVTERSGPEVRRLINTTDPFGTYAAAGARADGSVVGGRPWTPYTYLRDLVRARVSFELAGIQIYRPYRDLTDTVEMLERVEALGVPIYITEIGVPSRDDDFVTFSSDDVREPNRRPAHRWDPEQQADWVERMFTVLMSRPDVAGVAWYDVADHRQPFLPGGGLFDEAWRPKPAYRRIERLLVEVGRIPRDRAATSEGARPTHT